MTCDSSQPLILADARIRRYLENALGKEVISCETPVLIAQGIENRNYALMVHCASSTIPLILRCPPETIPDWRASEGLYDLEREYHILHELSHFDLPTPQVWGYDNSDIFGIPCFLMERLSGESMTWAYQPAYNETLIQRYAHAIAAICQLPYATRPRLAGLLPVWSIARSIAWYERRSYPHRTDTLVAYALAWMKEHQPIPHPLVLCHSDVNPGNFLVQDQRITGIIDWEFACVKDDPLAELTCVSWLEERPELREVFCHALGRETHELDWFLTCSYFGRSYAGDPSMTVPAQTREALARRVGFPGG